MTQPSDPNRRRSVLRCRRNAAALLVLLAAAAALAVPIRSREVVFQRDPQTNLVWRTTSAWGGYMFLPEFLKRDRSPFPAEDSYAVRYALRRSIEVREVRAGLNFPAVVVEAAVLAVLAAFDLAFYCPRRRTRRLPLPPSS